MTPREERAMIEAKVDRMMKEAIEKNTYVEPSPTVSRSSLHALIKTKEQGDELMKLLKLAEDGIL